MNHEYTIACILSQDTTRQLQSVFPSLDTLNIPHISLFQFQNNQYEIIKAMTAQLQTIQITNEFTANSIVLAGENVFLNIVHNQSLANASNVIADYYSLLCREVKPLSQIKLSELNDEESQLVKKYGIYWIKQKFHPHVTLSYQPLTIEKSSMNSPIFIRFDQVGIYPIDHVGRILSVELPS
jgi:hypothetical protein